jgi:hypothetical protein
VIAYLLPKALRGVTANPRPAAWAALALGVALVLAPQRPLPAQELPPPPPIVATGGDFEDFSCATDDITVASRPVCQQWRREMAEWKRRQAAAGREGGPLRDPEAISRRIAELQRVTAEAEEERRLLERRIRMLAADLALKADKPAAPAELGKRLPPGVDEAELRPVDRLYWVMVGRAEVRARPQRGTAAIMTVRFGEQVHVVGVLGTDWLRVASEGEPIGWLHWSALSEERPAVPVPTK